MANYQGRQGRDPRTSMAPTVTIDPVAEAIARKLSGYSGVPEREKGRMILRAVKAGRGAVNEELEQLRQRVVDLEGKLADTMDALAQTKANLERIRHAAASVSFEVSEVLAPVLGFPVVDGLPTTGELTAEMLAKMAADRIVELETSLPEPLDEASLKHGTEDRTKQEEGGAEVFRQKLWVLMSPDRKQIARGMTKNRDSHPVSREVRASLATFASEALADTATRGLWAYHKGVILEPVQVEVVMTEV